MRSLHTLGLFPSICVCFLWEASIFRHLWCSLHRKDSGDGKAYKKPSVEIKKDRLGFSLVWLLTVWLLPWEHTTQMTWVVLICCRSLWITVCLSVEAVICFYYDSCHLQIDSNNAWKPRGLTTKWFSCKALLHFPGKTHQIPNTSPLKGRAWMERKKGWHGNRHLGEMFVRGGWYYLGPR